MKSIAALLLGVALAVGTVSVSGVDVLCSEVKAAEPIFKGPVNYTFTSHMVTPAADPATGVTPAPVAVADVLQADGTLLPTWGRLDKYSVIKVGKGITPVLHCTTTFLGYTDETQTEACYQLENNIAYSTSPSSVLLFLPETAGQLYSKEGNTVATFSYKLEKLINGKTVMENGTETYASGLGFIKMSENDILVYTEDWNSMTLAPAIAMKTASKNLTIQFDRDGRRYQFTIPKGADVTKYADRYGIGFLYLSEQLGRYDVTNGTPVLVIPAKAGN